MFFVFKLGHLLFPCYLVALYVTSFIKKKKKVNGFDALFHHTNATGQHIDFVQLCCVVLVILNWWCVFWLYNTVVVAVVTLHVKSLLLLYCCVWFALAKSFFSCCLPMLKFSYLSKLVKNKWITGCCLFLSVSVFKPCCC